MLDPYRNNQYLTLESHTDNMHRGGGTYGHGGIFPALSKEEALADLKNPLSIVEMEMHLHIRSGIIRQSVNRRWKRLDFYVQLRQNRANVIREMIPML